MIFHCHVSLQEGIWMEVSPTKRWGAPLNNITMASADLWGAAATAGSQGAESRRGNPAAVLMGSGHDKINGFIAGWWWLEHEIEWKVKKSSRNSWEFHHPNWRTLICFRGVQTTNQIVIKWWKWMISISMISMKIVSLIIWSINKWWMMIDDGGCITDPWCHNQ